MAETVARGLRTWIKHTSKNENTRRRKRRKSVEEERSEEKGQEGALFFDPDRSFVEQVVYCAPTGQVGECGGVLDDGAFTNGVEGSSDGDVSSGRDGVRGSGDKKCYGSQGDNEEAAVVVTTTKVSTRTDLILYGKRPYLS
jgi:hypothetical protein